MRAANDAAMAVMTRAAMRAAREEATAAKDAEMMAMRAQRDVENAATDAETPASLAERAATQDEWDAEMHAMRRLARAVESRPSAAA